MTYSNLTELQQALQEAVDGSALSLNQHLLPPGELADFVQTLPDLTLILQQPELNLSEQTLSLEGSLDNWSIPYLASTQLTQLRIRIVFSQPSEAHTISAAFNVEQAELSLLEHSLLMQGELQDDRIQLNLLPPSEGSSSSTVTASLPAYANFISAGTAEHLFPDGLTIFNTLNTSALSLDFNFNPDEPLAMVLAVSLGSEQWDIISNNLFTISQPAITLASRLQHDDEDTLTSSVSSMLTGKTTIASQSFDIAVSLTNKYAWKLSVKPEAGEVFSGLSSLANYIGGDDLAGVVNTGLQGVNTVLGISEITVDHVDVYFDPYNKQLKALSVAAHLTFFEARLNVTAQLPNFVFSANLPTVPADSTTDSGLHLKTVIEHFFGSSPDFPDVLISSLFIRVNPSAQDYRFSIEVSDIWHYAIGDTHFSLDKLGFGIHKSRTGLFGNFSATMTLASLQFDIDAEYLGTDQGWQLEGATAPDQTLSLSAIATELAGFFGLTVTPQFPQISLSNLDITFNTQTKTFGFAGKTETEIEVPFLTGDEAKIDAEVNLVSAIDTTTNRRQLSGFMEGEFSIGDSVFTLQYTLGQDSHVFEASWESEADDHLLGINSILEAMGVNNDISLPEQVDLNLKKIYLRYQVERQTLQLVADSATYGEVFLIVSKLPIGQPHPNDEVPEPGQGTWQFVFGWDYPDLNKFSQAPGFGSAFDAANIFHLQSLGLIVSSAQISQFDIPAFPELTTLSPGVAPNTQQALTRKPVGQGSAIPLGKGLAFVATMDLGQSEQGGSMQALRQIVTETTLTVMATIDLSKEAFSISAILQGSITIPTGGSSNLRLGNAGLSFIFNDGIIFQLYGDLAMHFDHQTIDVQPRLSISLEEIEFSVPIRFEDGWHSPMGITGLTLDEIAFAMGINLLPAPGVNIGLQGESHIGDQPRASDNFAFILEIIEEIPDPLLLSFYLAEVDIKTALEVFVGQQAEQVNLPDIVNDINLTDVSFYWAESVVVMPDGTIAQPGLRFGGNLEVLGFAAHARLAIDQSSGIVGEFETSPIHFHNVLSVTGKGQGVYLNQKGGKTLPVTIKPESDTNAITRVEVVPPGGPVFALRTAQSPYLQMSIKVSFLDLLSEELEALVANDGIYFKLEYDIAKLVRAEIDVTLNKTGFVAHSLFGLHLKADIGPIKILGIDFGSIHLDTGFDIELFIRADADEFEFRVNGEFEFEGARLSFPEIHLAFAPKSLAELPEMIIQQVIDHAEDIFKDLFDAAAELVKEGIKEVEHLAEEAAEEVSKLANEAEHEAEKLINDAEQAVEHSVEEAAEAIKAIDKEAEKILTDAAEEVEHLAEEAVQEVEKIGTEIAHVAEAAEHEVEAIGREIAQEATEVAQAVERLASEAVAEVKAIGESAAKAAKAIVDEARKVADAVIHAARQVVDALEKEAKALWDEAKKLADAIANAAKKVGHAVEHAAKSAWHAVSKY